MASARYDDVLDIGMRCARVGTSSAIFVGGAFRDQQLLVSCTLTYVFADPRRHGLEAGAARAARAVRPASRRGESMVDVRVGSWAELGADARPIRTQVFIAEQKIPAEMEWDDADDGAVHAVAYNRLGQALATGRMLEHVPGVAKIGRMAVAASSRHSGVGRAVLEALLEAARSRGEREAVLHAQLERRAVLRARRLRAPRAGVRRDRHRPRRDAARALSALLRSFRAQRSIAAASRSFASLRTTGTPRRGASRRRDATSSPPAASISASTSGTDAVGRARQRIGLHPGLRRRAVAGAGQQARDQPGMRLRAARRASPRPRGARRRHAAASTR